MWKRLRRRMFGAEPVTENQPQKSRIEAPIIAGATRGTPKTASMALVMGLPAEDLVTVVDGVAAGAKQAGVAPVFVTDRLHFTNFRAHEAVFEYLPPENRIAEAIESHLALAYRERRMMLLLRKWRPWRVIAYGSIAKEWLAHMRSLQALDEEMAQALGIEMDGRADDQRLPTAILPSIPSTRSRTIRKPS